MPDHWLTNETLSSHVLKSQIYYHKETSDPKKRLQVKPTPKHNSTTLQELLKIMIPLAIPRTKYFCRVLSDVMNKVAIPWLCHEHNSWVGRCMIRGPCAEAWLDLSFCTPPLSPQLGLWLLKKETEPGDRQSLTLVLVPSKYFLFCAGLRYLTV